MKPGMESGPQRSPARNPLPWRELSKLPKQEREALKEATAIEVLRTLRSHGEELSINKLNEALRGEEYVVRRESPEKILGTLEEGALLDIDFPEGERYSNAVVWSPAMGSRGLENAYLEGYGQAHGIVTVMGIRRNAVEDIVQLPDATRHFAHTNREQVRSVRGTVRPEDIAFVTVRVPAEAFPLQDMQEAERERYEEWQEAGKPKPLFIYRGYLFTKHLAKQ